MKHLNQLLSTNSARIDQQGLWMFLGAAPTERHLARPLHAFPTNVQRTERNRHLALFEVSGALLGKEPDGRGSDTWQPEEAGSQATIYRLKAEQRG